MIYVINHVPNLPGLALGTQANNLEVHNTYFFSVKCVVFAHEQHFGFQILIIITYFKNLLRSSIGLFVLGYVCFHPRQHMALALGWKSSSQYKDIRKLKHPSLKIHIHMYKFVPYKSLMREKKKFWWLAIKQELPLLEICQYELYEIRDFLLQDPNQSYSFREQTLSLSCETDLGSETDSSLPTECTSKWTVRSNTKV